MSSPISVLCVVSLWLCLPLAAQENSGQVSGTEGSTYSMRLWSPGSGIPHGTVSEVIRDPSGFVWLGTFDGLARFDGHRFRVYNLANSPGLAGNRIATLFFDRRGDLWIGHEADGLSVYRDGRFTSFSEQDGLPGGTVWSIAEDSDGALWLATDGGLARWPDPLSGTAVETIYSGYYLSVSVDREGVVWGGSANGLKRYPEAVRESRRSSELALGPMIFELMEDEGGRFWAASRRGLFVRNPKTSDWRQMVKAECPPSSSVSQATVTVDREGAVWFKPCAVTLLDSDSRIYRIALEQGLGSASVEAFDLQGIPATPALLGAREGGLWLGSLGQGLSLLQPQIIKRWTFPAGSNVQELRAVLGDDEGNLWLSADCRAPLLRFRAGEFIEHDLGPDERLSCIGALARTGDGDLLLGAGGELARLRDGRLTERRRLIEEQGGAHWINAILESTEGDLWIGFAGRGLARLRGEQRVDWTRADGLPSDHVHFLAEARDGAIWIGTNRGLGRYENGRFTVFGIEQGVPPGTVRTIYEDPDGSLWIGTYGGGLARFKAGKISRITSEQGLFDNVVTHILPDRRGNLWMLGNAGLFYVSLEELNALVEGRRRTVTSIAFDHTDGMIEGSGGRQPAGWRAEDGRMWFPTINGLASIDAESFRADDISPIPQIEEALVEGRLLMDMDRIELLPGERDLEIHYTAPSAAPVEKMRFQYRMKGYVDGWIDAGTRRTAFYTNLPPGTYSFQAKAANRYGRWSEEVVSIPVVVVAPWWRTQWAYLSYALMVGALFFGILQWQQRRVEQERAVNRRLREVDRIKDEILANTSHELRTPLFGMIGLAESLLGGASGTLPEPARSSLRTLIRSGRRLSDLVDGILDFSKLKNDTSTLHLEPHDLGEVCEQAIALMKPLAEAKGLALEIRIDPVIPKVSMDSAKVQQILINLLGNAIKFTESGRVELAAELENGMAVVRVADDGIGIAAEDQNRIFEAFEQVDASIARVYGGTGLGLALTRRLVELHGGRVWIDSTPGEGSVFSFTLLPVEVGEPRSPDPESSPELPPIGTKTEREQAPRSSELAEIPGSEGEGGEAAAVVLVVDDEPINREVLVSQLVVAGYRTECASSGSEALERLDTHEFDLVLLDVMMPNMSGYEVCRIIRRSFNPQQLPVIFLTAKSRVDDRVAGLKEGGNDYLTKPVAMEELMARVDTQIRLKTAYERLDELLEQRTEQVEMLGELLPICAACKKIRDDKGYWEQLEVFISTRSQVQFSHGLCPDCIENTLEDLDSLP